MEDEIKKDEVVIEEEEKSSEFVSKEEFGNLQKDMTKSFAQIIEMIKARPEPEKIVQQKIDNKKLETASSDTTDFNPRYDAKAKEILGDKFERTYLTYPRGGGTLFTVVIKKEFSNAPKDYLERYKEDKRTVNIERDEYRGEDGVEKWCRLILQNLNRTIN